LLQNLYTDLKEKTHQFLGIDMTLRPTTPKYRFIDTVRKVLIARMKTQDKTANTLESTKSDCEPANGAGFKKASRRSYSVSSSPETTKSPKVQESTHGDNYSCKSMPLELNFEPVNVSMDSSDNNDKMDSMSSSEAVKSISFEKLDENGCHMNKLTEEIDKLKRDKLELLRLNVIFQRNLKQMKEREVALEEDLSAAAKEIGRLRSGYKN
jgi:RAP1 GTPase activating protein 1